jgi:hypothetical protein
MRCNPWSARPLAGGLHGNEGASGRAQLDWQPLDEQQYRLTWRIELAGRESLAWRSQGHVGPAGLMPDRMVEQRQGVIWRPSTSSATRAW